MNIERFLFNDILAQFYRNYHFTEEMKLKKQQQITNCNHLFVYTENDDKIPVIECVHCGLSNRMLNFYFKFMEHFDPKTIKIAPGYPEELPFEASLFIHEFPNSFVNGKFVFNSNDYRIISNQIISTWHASILYKAACEIEATGSLEKIFQIMTDLNSLETEYEHVSIAKIQDAYELIRRYSTLSLPNQEQEKPFVKVK